MVFCEGTCLLGYAFVIFLLYKLLDHVIRKPQIGKLDTRYILITGCDTGFGNELAKQLDRMGCHVFAGCLTDKGADELKKYCSPKLDTIIMDVANPDSVRKAYEVVKGKLPAGVGLWGLMNNAGIVGLVGPVEWLQLKDYHKVLNVNLLGLIDVTTTFLPLIKKAKGRIVNTASVFGRYTIAGCPPYCISKYGVETFSDCLRRQLRPFKVSVHLIEPGFHKTNITSEGVLVSGLKGAWAQTPQEIKQEYGDDFVEQSINAVVKQLISGVISEKIQDVVDAYKHALLGQIPRGRYVVGTDAKYLWLPLQMLPEWLGDKIVELMNPTRPIPAACRK